MIKTKQIFQPKYTSDGTRILITYGVSDKLKEFPFDEHIGALAPSLDLLSAYKGWKGKPISWDEYEKCFVEEMESPQSKEAIAELAKRSFHGETITLLCYEKEENPHCHRHIVKRLILEAENELKNKGVRNEV
jgi:uncharacterized protein YeaO (DUF488 family)